MFQDNSLLGRSVYGLAKLMAMVGGIVLIALVLLIVVSVIGRSLLWAGLRPVMGDYELVEAGVGFAVFAFLPWGHLERGHALVALFTDRMGPRVNSWILVVTDLMMMLTAAFITWRLFYGMLDKFEYNETTLLLRVPLGWTYAAGLVGGCVFVVIAIYVFGRSITNALTGRREAEHLGGGEI